MEVRLNKFVSDSGFCSRREADRYIENGSVRVNGHIAQVGTKVSPGDVIKINGTLIECEGRETVYLALNKPVGVVSTTDPLERDNIVDFVNYPTRIFNIGRLDKPSEGLILLTNDGDIVNKILRAANNHEKEYEVMVDRNITEEFLKRMAAGVPILGTVTKRCKITQEGANRFRITLTQGLNRQIRRMCEYLGYEVVRLKRVRIMNISLGKLPSGQWRELTTEEVRVLTASLQHSDNSAAASRGAGAGKGSSVSKSASKQSGASTGTNTSKVAGAKGASRGASKGVSRGSGTSKSSGGSKPQPQQRAEQKPKHKPAQKQRKPGIETKTKPGRGAARSRR